ncbi:hypothetical protein [Brevibacillus fulvus]|uniref:Uncharacterized protein n=1 Tax=Brevibacillus fulvus TaxID=1125967 RepID=A0A939BVX9_9BACL|nr:hypothetical protein [Brevibacillus fulvus]MBM7591196.1 hypothetical protein [Brevibacillus fulvus]
MGFFDKKMTLDVVAGSPHINSKNVVIMKGSTPDHLCFQTSPFKPKLEVKIEDISFGEQSTRSAGKAVAGAIVGGVLTGGIGLLVGGAIGGRKKDDSRAIVSYLDDAGKEHKLYLKCNGKQYAELVSLLNG